LKMVDFPTFKGSWPWHWIGSYCIPSCSPHRLLPTYQIQYTRVQSRAYVV